MITRSQTKRLLYFAGFLPAVMMGGEFINLSFDNPDLSQLQTDPILDIQYGTPGDLVPGWTITQDGVPINRVWYYNQGTAKPVTLQDNSLTDVPFRGPHYVSYSGEYHPSAGVEIDKTTSFVQQGTIPPGTASLAFFWAGKEFESDRPLHINGETVDFSLQGALYVADVSPWAGQDVVLSFDFKAGSASYLDSISFVPGAVPEPSTWALAAFGGLALWWVGRKARR